MYDRHLYLFSAIIGRRPSWGYVTEAERLVEVYGYERVISSCFDPISSPSCSAELFYLSTCILFPAGNTKK